MAKIAKEYDLVIKITHDADIPDAQVIPKYIRSNIEDLFIDESNNGEGVTVRLVKFSPRKKVGS